MKLNLVKSLAWSLGLLLTGLLLGNSPLVYAQGDDASSPRTDAAAKDENKENDDIELDTLGELFEGLDDELDGDLDDSELGGEGDSERPAGEDIRLDGRGEPLSDEDLDENADPATRIGKIMKQVQRLLKEKELGKPTQDRQEQIVKELAEWLKQLEQQQKKSSSQSQNSQSQQKPQPHDERKTPQQASKKPTSGNSGQTGSQTTGQTKADSGESDDELRDRLLEKSEFADIREDIEELWGELPEKDRELIRQMADVELLPEYAPLIRRYFRRLAEDRMRRP